jgi:hypothetical protein
MKKLMILFTLLFFVGLAGADQDITFEWDANTDEVTGYRLYQRPNDGAYDYENPVAEIPGRETNRHMLEDVQPGTWCWVLRAHDDEGNESGDSNEVSATVDPDDEKPRNIRFPQ